MAADATSDTTYYRLAAHVRVRFIGLYLVALAVLVFALTAILLLARFAPYALLVALALGVVGLGVFGWWLHARAFVMKATPDGYEVRLVRSAGTKIGRWAAVEDAVTTSPHGIDCVVLRLKDGGTTTIPVELLEVDKDQFVRELQGYLQRGQLKK
jgi:hypothetical protein